MQLDLSERDADWIPEHCPEHAGVAGWSGKRAVVTVIFVQMNRKQLKDVKACHLHFLTCGIQ